ncbi:ubiquinol oxidase 1b, mitochondrial-like [Triticum dicoccoides]|uniref:ubiquinol oxidase 1b, mitochondrial-like n=1 Tax=Triticum dicoccoides TaxID=85692 RepID=UPI0018904BE9|nr:ubiquinol oxidase 1b, mitochondrial-like [Triticum dicoccoides]
MPGYLNDINVVNRSPLMSKFANGELPLVQFVANGRTYNHDYYLADGIYPKWQTFVKPLKKLEAPARRRATAVLHLHCPRSAATSHANQESSAEKPESASTPEQSKRAVVSYWGIEPRKLVKDDGTEWPWFCFRPWDTSIDVTKHHEPKALADKVAYFVVRSLRVPRDIFFQRRHASHALLLETVAAVPPMVGGVLLHLRSLRRFEHSGGWIRALIEEAENERMHLMTFMEDHACILLPPRWWERALVLAAQGVFVNAYFVGYLISPKFAHRFVGYLEEEAVDSYTEYLKDLEAGLIENTPAPAIAIDYWRLPADARLKDLVTAVRADEAHHRDANHYASDIHYQGMTLNQTPASLGYH